MRIAKQGLIVRCSRLGKYHGAAVVITRGGKARGHIAAQERDIGAVDAVRERQCASGLIAIWRIGERGLGIEGYSGQIDNVLASEAGNRSLKVQGLCSWRNAIKDQRSLRARECDRFGFVGTDLERRTAPNRRRVGTRRERSFVLARGRGRRRIVEDRAAGAFTGEVEVGKSIGSTEAQTSGLAAAITDCENAVGKAVLNRTVFDVPQVDLIGARQGAISGEIEN